MDALYVKYKYKYKYCCQSSSDMVRSSAQLSRSSAQLRRSSAPQPRLPGWSASQKKELVSPDAAQDSRAGGGVWIYERAADTERRLVLEPLSGATVTLRYML